MSTTYILKPEYRGLSITRNHPIAGMITLDTLKVPEEFYGNYYDLGFDFVFEPMANPKYKLPIQYKGVPDEKPEKVKRPRVKKNKDTDGQTAD